MTDGHCCPTTTVLPFEFPNTITLHEKDYIWDKNGRMSCCDAPTYLPTARPSFRSPSTSPTISPTILYIRTVYKYTTTGDVNTNDLKSKIENQFRFSHPHLVILNITSTSIILGTKLKISTSTDKTLESVLQHELGEILTSFGRDQTSHPEPSEPDPDSKFSTTQIALITAVPVLLLGYTAFYWKKVPKNKKSEQNAQFLPKTNLLPLSVVTTLPKSLLQKKKEETGKKIKDLKIK